jgi:alkylhydroperoxidase family enzyme
MPRVPLVDSESLPESYAVIEEKGDRLPEGVDSAFWNRQPTVRAFSNNPALGETHVTANTDMWTETGLTASEVECVILTIAREFDSAYEWHDHVIAAVERAGMSAAEVRAINDGALDRLDDRYRLLVEYTTEYVRERGSVGDETHDRLAGAFDEATVVGVVMLAGFYVSLSHEIAALGLELEEEFVGWRLENYPPDE